jgi:predicted type IV restriction endonuclease
MSLEDTIKDIVARLRDNGFPNESAISQGIVLRLLQALDWPTWDTKTIWPEYQTGDGRADYALCHPPAKPVVVIEVKKPGKAEESVGQALEYAFHTGAPMVVLTDGQTWSFYLPGEQGSYEDRRVYKLDLYERTPLEAAGVFRRYISREGIASGNALDAAKKEYRSRNRRSQARAAIPEAWRELVEKGDEVLVELLASAVESKTGAKPDDDDVAEFLVGLSRPLHQASVSRRSPTVPIRESNVPLKAPREGSASSRGGTVLLFGEKRQYGNFKDAMVATLTELAKREPTFLERCAQHQNNQGRTRRYISRTVEALYPGRPDLYEASAELPGGWFIGTNMNNLRKKSIMKMAAEVAGLSFGKDFILDF